MQKFFSITRTIFFHSRSEQFLKENTILSFQPLESVSIDRVRCDVAHIAMAVLEKLKTKDPNHPIFAMEDDEKLLKHDVLLTEDRFGGGKHSIAILDALNEAFFQDMGFRGNTANYYNPANSFIDKVLENRQGIPDLKKNITGCLIIIWTGLYIKIGIVQ